MVTKVIRHRYGLTETNGFLTGDLHNWDGKTFDKNGYPVADCGERLYPRYLIINTNGAVCKDCFK